LIILEPELLPQYIKQLPLICSLSGIFIAYCYVFRFKNINKYNNIFNYMVILFFAKR